MRAFDRRGNGAAVAAVSRRLRAASHAGDDLRPGGDAVTIARLALRFRLPLPGHRSDASSMSTAIPAPTRRRGSRRPMQETPYSPGAQRVLAGLGSVQIKTRRLPCCPRDPGLLIDHGWRPITAVNSRAVRFPLLSLSGCDLLVEGVGVGLLVLDAVEVLAVDVGERRAVARVAEEQVEHGPHE